MQKWDYMDLCPDGDAGYRAMLDAGEEGWEAVCSWQEHISFNAIDPRIVRVVNHILYKRPAEPESREDSAV